MVSREEMAAFTTEHQHKAASDMSSDEKKEAKKLATAAKKAVKSLATKQEKVKNIQTGEKEKQYVYPKAKSQFEAGEVAFKAGEFAQAEAAFKQVPRGRQPAHHSCLAEIGESSLTYFPVLARGWPSHTRLPF